MSRVKHLRDVFRFSVIKIFGQQNQDAKPLRFISFFWFVFVLGIHVGFKSVYRHELDNEIVDRRKRATSLGQLFFASALKTLTGWLISTQTAELNTRSFRIGLNVRIRAQCIKIPPTYSPVIPPYQTC